MCVTSRLPCLTAHGRCRRWPGSNPPSAESVATVAGSGRLAHADRRCAICRERRETRAKSARKTIGGSDSAARLDEFRPAKPERGPVLVYRHLPHGVKAELLQHAQPVSRVSSQNRKRALVFQIEFRQDLGQATLLFTSSSLVRIRPRQRQSDDELAAEILARAGHGDGAAVRLH